MKKSVEDAKRRVESIATAAESMEEEGQSILKQLELASSPLKPQSGISVEKNDHSSAGSDSDDSPDSTRHNLLRKNFEHFAQSSSVEFSRRISQLKNTSSPAVSPRKNRLEDFPGPSTTSLHVSAIQSGNSSSAEELIKFKSHGPNSLASSRELIDLLQGHTRSIFMAPATETDGENEAQNSINTIIHELSRKMEATTDIENTYERLIHEKDESIRELDIQVQKYRKRLELTTQEDSSHLTKEIQVLQSLILSKDNDLKAMERKCKDVELANSNLLLDKTQLQRELSAAHDELKESQRKCRSFDAKNIKLSEIIEKAELSASADRQRYKNLLEKTDTVVNEKLNFERQVAELESANAQLHKKMKEMQVEIVSSLSEEHAATIVSLKEQISLLQKSNSSITKEVDAYRLQISDYKTSLENSSSLNDLLLKTKEELKQKDLHFTALRSELDKVQIEKSESLRSSEEKSQEIILIREQMEVSNRRYKELQNEHVGLKSTFDEFKDRFTHLEAKLQDSRHELEKSQNLVSNLESKLASVQSQKSEGDNRIKFLEQTLHASQNDTRTDLDNALQQLRERDEQVYKLKQDCIVLKQQISEFQDTYLTLQNSFEELSRVSCEKQSALQKTLDMFTDEINTQKKKMALADIEGLKIRIVNAESSNQKLQSQMSLILKELDQYNSIVEEYESTFKVQESHIEDMKKQIEVLETERDGQSHIIGLYSHDIQLFKKKADQAHDELNQSVKYKEENDMILHRIAILEREKKDLLFSKENLEQEVSSRQREANDAKSLISQLEEKCKQISDELEVSTARHSKLLESKTISQQDLLSKIATLEGKNLELEKSIQEKEESFFATSLEIDSLKKQLGILEEALECQSSQLQMAQITLSEKESILAEHETLICSISSDIASFNIDRQTIRTFLLEETKIFDSNINSIKKSLGLKIQDYLEEFNERTSVLENKLVEADKKVSELKADLEAKNKSIAELDHLLNQKKESEKDTASTLKGRLETTSLELRQAKQELIKVNIEKKDLEMKLEEKIGNISDLEKNVSDLKYLVEQLEGKLFAAEEEQRNLSRESCAKIGRLSSERDLLQEQMESSKYSSAKLNGELVSLRTELNHYQSEFDAMKMKLSNEKTIAEKLKKDLFEFESKEKVWAKNSDSLAAEKKSLEAKIDQYVKTIMDFEKEIQSAKREYELSQDQVTQQKDIIDGLNSSLEVRNHENNLLKEDLQERSDLIKRIQAENCKTLSYLKQTHFETVEKLKSMISNKEESKTFQVSSIMVEFARKESEMGLLTKLNTDSESRLNDMELLLSTKNELIAEKDIEIHRLQQETKNAVSGLKELEQNLEDQKIRIGSWTEKATNLDLELSKFKDELAQKCSENEKLHERLNDVQRSLESSNRDSSLASQELFALKSLNGILETELKEKGEVMKCSSKTILCCMQDNGLTVSTDFQQNIESVCAQITRLSKLREGYLLKISEMETAISDKDKSINLKSKYIKEVEEELISLQNLLRDYESKLEEGLESLNYSQEARAKMQHKIDDLSNKLAEVQKLVSVKDESIAELCLKTSSFESLQKQLACQEEEITRLNSNLSSQRKDLSQINSIINNAQSLMSSLGFSDSDIIENLHSISHSLKEKSKMFLQMEKQYQDISYQLKLVEEQLSVESKRSAAILTEKNQILESLERHEKRFKKKSADLQNLEKELRECQEMIKNLSQNYEKQTKGLEAEILTMDMENKELIHKNELLAIDIESKESQLKHLSESLDELKLFTKEASEKDDDLAKLEQVELRDKLQLKEGEAILLKVQLQELIAEKEKIEKDNMQLKEAMDNSDETFKKSLNLVRNELEETSKKFMIYEAMYQQMNESNEELRESLTTSQEELQEMSEKLMVLTSEKIEYMNEITELRGQKSALDEALMNLNEKLADVQLKNAYERSMELKADQFETQVTAQRNSLVERMEKLEVLIAKYETHRKHYKKKMHFLEQDLSGKDDEVERLTKDLILLRSENAQLLMKLGKQVDNNVLYGHELKKTSSYKENSLFHV